MVSCIAVACALAVADGALAVEADRPHRPPRAIAGFLEQHCAACHSGDQPEGGLDLAGLRFDPDAPAGDRPWARVIERVAAGEMPPPDADQPEPAAARAFHEVADRWLLAEIAARDERHGRVRARRLSRRELERSLHAALGIDIPLAGMIPEEGRPGGYSTAAARQTMSHHQLERHLAVVDAALDEAFRRAVGPGDELGREFDAAGICRVDPKVRCREPELLRDRAVVWANGITYYGRIPATTAPADGWYRFRIRVAAVNPPATGGVWSTVHTGLCVSSAPLLEFVTDFEAQAEPREIEFEAWIPRDHMLEIRPGDVTLKQAKFAGGQIGTGEGEPQQVPGIAIERLSMERIHRGPDDPGLRRLVFGSVPLEPMPNTGDRRPRPSEPDADLERLITAVARRAFRRPLAGGEASAAVALARRQLAEGGSFEQALRAGYRAVLCSPRFLYFVEEPGPLDDHAVAARLSYFLTGGPPDDELSAAADAGRLRDAAALRHQVDRLLAGPGAALFVRDFAAEWLDLDQIDFTEPDRKLYKGFDAVVKQSMLSETHHFLEELLREDRPVSWLADAGVTYLDSRLARYYGIPDVVGDEIRRVEVGESSHRGGLLAQGAILKVTANGNNTSPVVRGAWVSERILGVEVPPPPGGVPAIEPDIRGATSIREQLARHRGDAACATCHRIIDPPGFALENFDPAGTWRERYLALQNGSQKGGIRVDVADTLADGREFADFSQFRQLLAADRERLAGSLAGHMLAYGTGAALSYADRKSAQKVAKQAAADDHGFAAIVRAVVTSPLFLNK
jgi:mono/diheme cytochrome c family protein